MQYFFIGESELATAFRFVGVGSAPVSTIKEAQAAFRRVTTGWIEEAGSVLPSSLSVEWPESGSCRVLVLTEEVADGLGAELADWQLAGKYPLVVELPGLMGRMESRKTLVDAIREAIGVRV
ncbi:MAG: ATPase V [Treponema sp. GWB1_62_6]|nr:MAG: ATPase V [Treponema sp. GWB1_62_6]OHE67691.1 MAG: ATPase V [Treponema sp. GWC1_61_84]OHE76856.1 MAG: ATPase V [Treponema sp. RIFOXYC1_FULL_61_9]HCM29058.1 ATPase V [Treponema sp.]